MRRRGGAANWTLRDRAELELLRREVMRLRKLLQKGMRKKRRTQQEEYEEYQDLMRELDGVDDDEDEEEDES